MRCAARMVTIRFSESGTGPNVGKYPELLQLLLQRYVPIMVMKAENTLALKRPNPKQMTRRLALLTPSTWLLAEPSICVRNLQVWFEMKMQLQGLLSEVNGTNTKKTRMH